MRKRDMNKYCCFHEDYGHDTNECNQLKDEIEFYARDFKLVKVLKPTTDPARFASHVFADVLT